MSLWERHLKSPNRWVGSLNRWAGSPYRWVWSRQDRLVWTEGGKATQPWTLWCRNSLQTMWKISKRCKEQKMFYSGGNCIISPFYSTYGKWPHKSINKCNFDLIQLTKDVGWAAAYCLLYNMEQSWLSSRSTAVQLSSFLVGNIFNEMKGNREIFRNI